MSNQNQDDMKMTVTEIYNEHHSTVYNYVLSVLKNVHDAEEAMLAAVKQADVALEISSAGLRKPVAEVYPHARIVARAAELGIPISFGSDAHAPGEVGHAMDACLSILEMCGVTEIATFLERVRQMQPIRRLSDG